MSQNNFVELAGQFVIPTSQKNSTSYTESYKQTTDYKDDIHNVAFDFQNELAFFPNKKSGTTPAFFIVARDYNARNANDKYRETGLDTVFDVIYRLEQGAKKAKIDMPQFRTMLDHIETLHNNKKNFSEKYHLFSLGVKKYYLESEEVSHFFNFADNLDNIEAEIKELNKQSREVHKYFMVELMPYLFEKYKSYTHIYKTKNGYYNREKTEKNLRIDYLAVQSFATLFPVIKLSTKTIELMKELRSLEAKGEKVRDKLSSAEAVNAKKKILGYIIYGKDKYHDPEHDEGEAEDGFVTAKGELSQNILAAQICDTEKQAYSFARRKGYRNCIITEINFSFSKIMTAHDCEAGPAMASLKARTESRQLQELIAPALSNEHANGETPVVRKRHKI